VRRALLIVLTLATLPAACGGEDEAPAPSTTTVSAATTSTSTSSTTTTPEPPAPAPGPGEGGGAESESLQPGSGAGAASAVIAAAAVLTREGTPEQACGSFVTDAFIRTSYGGEENCIAARRDEALARSISVGPGDDKDSTRIVVVPKGGPYDGVRVEVDLLEEDRGFRVDRLVADVPAGP